jgi:hypothetical protein
MIKVETKNGVMLYITLCDDCGENKGGYYCEVSLDEDGVFEYDNFVIHNEELECTNDKDAYIQFCCEEYAKGVDDMPILNEKFNKIYDTLSDVTNDLLNFYGQHIIFNKNIKRNEQMYFADMLDMIGNAKDRAHEIAEHYTWDD